MTEVTVVLILIVILAVMAAPTWVQYMEKQNLKDAAETLLSDFHLLRSEAIQRNKTMTMQFSTGTDWCYGMSEGPTTSCHCTTAPQACTIEGVSRLTTATSFKKIKLLSTTFASNRTGFEPTRGLALNSGTVIFQSQNGHNVTIDINPVGRIRICSSTIPAYSPC